MKACLTRSCLLCDHRQSASPLSYIAAFDFLSRIRSSQFSLLLLASRHGSHDSMITQRIAIRCTRAALATASLSSSTRAAPCLPRFSSPMKSTLLRHTPSSMTARRSFHSLSSLLSSSSPLLSSPSLTVPPGPTYDSPLPTLEAVPVNTTELQVDDSTKKRLKQLSAKHGRPVHLRVLVDQGGCSGLEYKFNIEVDEPPTEEDM